MAVNLFWFIQIFCLPPRTRYTQYHGVWRCPRYFNLYSDTEDLSQETMLLAWILINFLCYHSYLLDGQMVKRGVFDLIPNNRLGKRKILAQFWPLIIDWRTPCLVRFRPAIHSLVRRTSGLRRRYDGRHVVGPGRTINLRWLLQDKLGYLRYRRVSGRK